MSNNPYNFPQGVRQAAVRVLHLPSLTTQDIYIFGDLGTVLEQYANLCRYNIMLAKGQAREEWHEAHATALQARIDLLIEAGMTKEEPNRPHPADPVWERIDKIRRRDSKRLLRQIQLYARYLTDVIPETN